MTYWLNDQMSCVDTPELLSRSDRNGNCQAWSGFFRDVLRVQGIAANRFRVWRDPDSDVIAAENFSLDAYLHQVFFARHLQCFHLIEHLIRLRECRHQKRSQEY